MKPADYAMIVDLAGQIAWRERVAELANRAIGRSERGDPCPNGTRTPEQRIAGDIAKALELMPVEQQREVANRIWLSMIQQLGAMPFPTPQPPPTE